MAYIPLTKGKFALVDDEDFEWLFHKHWQFSSGGYAKTGIKGEFMHRLIMKASIGTEIDHINQNKLDNRKENLRFVNHSQNVHNTRERKDNTSGQKGVNFHKPRKRWVARIQIGNKRYFLGAYMLKFDAVMAYRKAETEFIIDGL